MSDFIVVQSVVVAALAGLLSPALQILRPCRHKTETENRPESPSRRGWRLS
jgi:hypothetical protein